MSEDVQLVKGLVDRFPVFLDLYECHVFNQDGVLPHVFFWDVTQEVVRAYVSGDEALDWKGVLDFLEERVTSGGRGVLEVIVTSFLGYFPYPSQPGCRLAEELGPELSRRFRTIRAPRDRRSSVPGASVRRLPDAADDSGGFRGGLLGSTLGQAGEEVKMGEAAAFSREWKAVVEANDSLDREIYRIPSEALLSVLRQALVGTPSSQHAALRILGSAAPATTVEILPALAPFLLVDHSRLSQCRQLVQRLERREMFAFLAELTDRVTQGESDAEAYRRLAEFLRQVEAPDLLRLLTSSARSSSDAEVREVAEDFSRCQP